MAAASRILWLSPDGYPQSIAATDTVTADGVSWSFPGNVAIGGDLDVAGDIISRNQVNVVIQDSFLDLGFGNTSSTSTSGGFTVQMNRSAAFTAGNVTTFNSSSSFTYTDASGSTLLAGGDIVAITNMPTDFAQNEGFFVVANVDQGSFPQVVTIATSATTSVPFAQTAFSVTGSFPATVTPSGSAFKSDISVLAVADGTTAFKNASGSAFNKGTFVQAYIPAATVTAFQANGAYNVIGGTTLQQAYNNGNTIVTSGSTDIGFTLTSGNFSVQGAGNVDMGSTTAIGSLAVTASGAITLNSAAGNINIGSTVSTLPINIGTAGARIVTLGQGVGTGPTIILDGTTNTTTIESLGQLAIGTSFGGTETINLGSATGGVLGYTRNINIGTTSGGSTTIYGPTTITGGIISLSSGTSATNITPTSGTLTLDGSTSGIINIGTLGGTGAINIGTVSSRAISIGFTANLSATRIDVGAGGFVLSANATAGTIQIGTDAGTGTISIGTSTATRAIAIGTGAADGAITIGTSASLGRSVTIGNSTGTSSLSLQAGTGALEIGTAGTNKTITIGQTANSSLLAIRGGTGGITLDVGATSGTIALTGSSASLINIGQDTGTGTVSIASSTGARQIDIGAGGAVQVINIGSGTNALAAKTINIGTAGTGAKTVTIGESTVAGSRVIITGGTGTGATAAIAIGNDAVAGEISIASQSASTRPVTIGDSAGVQVLKFGTGAAQKTVTIGSLTALSATTIYGSSTGNLTISTGSTSGTINLTNTGSADINIGNDTGTGVISIASSTGTHRIDLGNGSATQTVNVGTGAGVKTVNVGSTNSSSITTVQAGTGKVYVASSSGAIFGTSTGSTYTPAGVRVLNNTAGSFAEGDILVNNTASTPATGSSDVVKANAGTTGKQGFAGVALGAITNGTAGDAASIQGTVCKVSFASSAGDLPAAGDTGKPVFLSTTDGLATMNAPSTSGSRVYIIGNLQSSTAASGTLYYVALAPQFIADIA